MVWVGGHVGAFLAELVSASGCGTVMSHPCLLCCAHHPKAPTAAQHVTLLQINIPAPVGMICVGLFLRNVAGAVLITGLKPSWSKEIRAAALAMIFLRSGLELNLSVQPLDADRMLCLEQAEVHMLRFTMCIACQALMKCESYA